MAMLNNQMVIWGPGAPDVHHAGHAGLDSQVSTTNFRWCSRRAPTGRFRRSPDEFHDVSRENHWEKNNGDFFF